MHELHITHLDLQRSCIVVLCLSSEIRMHHAFRALTKKDRRRRRSKADDTQN